tara:strand:- start:36110 stop:36301 length:192 start_codon:yes stop_codon:yes gene_type:complete
MRYVIVVLFTALMFGCSLFSANDEQEIVNGFKVATIETPNSSGITHEWAVLGLYYFDCMNWSI